MPQVASIIPVETDTYCEDCGYVLNGLPETGRCPECGRPIAQSRGEHRRPASFETAPPVAGAALAAAASVRQFLRLLLVLLALFVGTTFSILFTPTRFHRSLATRHISGRALWFARCHWGLAAILLAVAASSHVILSRVFQRRYSFDEPVMFSLLIAPFAVIAYAIIALITRLATRLTIAYAADRGIWLPPRVVRRGLYFHSVRYVLVALLAASAECVYMGLVLAGGPGPTPSLAWRVYLYTLCGAATLCFAYLFVTYRIAMRSMMYANDR